MEKPVNKAFKWSINRMATPTNRKSLSRSERFFCFYPKTKLALAQGKKQKNNFFALAKKAFSIRNALLQISGANLALKQLALQSEKQNLFFYSLHAQNKHSLAKKPINSSMSNQKFEIYILIKKPKIV